LRASPSERQEIDCPIIVRRRSLCRPHVRAEFRHPAGSSQLSQIPPFFLRHG
jgi:hypothetical protein